MAWHVGLDERAAVMEALERCAEEGREYVRANELSERYLDGEMGPRRVGHTLATIADENGAVEKWASKSGGVWRVLL